MKILENNMRIIKIIICLEFQATITKTMKILEFHLRVLKIIKKKQNFMRES